MGFRLGSKAMDAATAVMIRHRWAEGFPDGINGYVTKASLKVVKHRLWFGKGRDELCPVYLPKTYYA